jgi:hypothetical protein
MRHYLVLCISLAIGLTAACKKQEPIPGTNSTADQQMAPVSPRGPLHNIESPATPPVIADSADSNATLQQLTQALRDYVVRTRSVPKNFEEFASKSQASFPPAPEGKKYAIQGQAVVLVKR